MDVMNLVQSDRRRETIAPMHFGHVALSHRRKNYILRRSTNLSNSAIVYYLVAITAR